MCIEEIKAPDKTHKVYPALTLKVTGSFPATNKTTVSRYPDLSAQFPVVSLKAFFILPPFLIHTFIVIKV